MAHLHITAGPMPAASTPSLTLDAAAAEGAASFDLVICASAGPSFLDKAGLTTLVTRAKPGGAVEVREIVWRCATTVRAPRACSLRNADGLRRAMLYAGLAPPADAGNSISPLETAGVPVATLVGALYPDLAAAATGGAAEAADALDALVAQLSPRLGVCVLRATRPAHAPGASFSLKSRAAIKSAPVPPPATAPPTTIPVASPASTPTATAAAAAAAAWSALAAPPGARSSATAGAGAPDLLDEDDLLEAEDHAEKAAVTADCGTSNGGKRKACKNCSCGLREMLENEDNAGAPPPKSACGNCSLGDAFRCAGCPHLGKPAFVPGEELKLADSMLRPDAPAVPSAVGDKKVLGGGGVVKLTLDDTMDL